MMASLQISAEVSIQFIKDSDPESMELFYLLGMLPGGIAPKDLDKLWAKIMEYKNQNRNMKTNMQPSLLTDENVMSESPWRRAFYELKKNKFVDEFEDSKGKLNYQA